MSITPYASIKFKEEAYRASPSIFKEEMREEVRVYPTSWFFKRENRWQQDLSLWSHPLLLIHL